MKITQYFFSSIILLLVVITAMAQTGEVKGKVLDAKTLEPLPFSNIFINNTTLGVAADQNGSYILTNIPAGSNDIVFSFVGYQSYQKKIQIKSGETIQLDIRLVPDETVLETVVVSGTRDKEWDKQFKKFEKIFFGNTRFATSCKILNSWILDFKESETNGKSVFTATASQPLQIENLALGYRIDYHLKSLVSTSDGYSILGEVRFEELKNTDAKLLKTRDQNRADAYYGSLRHLLRAMVAGQVKEEGFNLYTDKGGENENNSYRTANFAAQLDKSIEVFKTDNIVLPDKNEGDFAIQIKKRLEVHYTRVRSAKVYNDVSYPVSWLQVNGGVLKVNSKGIVLNPANLVVLGAMNDARVANLLPYNYSPEVSEDLPDMVESPIQKKLIQLEEKVYLRTDKPYYYQGEKIWFKAYLNYRTPELMDSLSKVLYVELIDRNKKIVETKLLYIDGGAGAGSFDLGDKLETGNLYIRAYTHWMLNYEPETIFVKSIPIFGLFECPDVDLTSTPPETTTLELKFKSSKPSYKSREKIKLEFELKNQDGTPIPADLSVSVTDMQQVIGLIEETNILNGFLFFASQNVRNVHGIKFPVESGISLTGQYKNKKGNPERKNFAAVEGKFQNMKPIETDVIGNFWVSGFQFYDSTEIIFQELGKKKKFDGTISLREREVPSTEKLKIPVTLRIVKSESPQRIKLNDTHEKTILLKEVIINEEKPELNKDIIPKVYAKADITITGEEILESSRTSLVNAIRARVPGLNVAGGYLRIGSPSNFMGPASTEPLLIVDGLQFTGGGSDTNYSRLMQINPEMVDRVDVIKYGGAAIYGTRGGNGVIIVTTKGGEYATISQSPSTRQPEFFKIFKVAGYSRPLEFVSPDHSRPVRDFVPDNRSTLFWSPQVRTDDLFGIATVSFYAADALTKYKIVVEGITDFGEPVRGVFYIEISE